MTNEILSLAQEPLPPGTSSAPISIRVISLPRAAICDRASKILSRIGNI